MNEWMNELKYKLLTHCVKLPFPMNSSSLRPGTEVPLSLVQPSDYAQYTATKASSLHRVSRNLGMPNSELMDTEAYAPPQITCKIMCMYLYAFSARSSNTSIIFSKESIAPKSSTFTNLENQKTWELEQSSLSSLIRNMAEQGIEGERLQVWVLLTNKHHCSALWKQINHQDLKNPSPQNAPVLDSKHIFFSPPSQHL